MPYRCILKNTSVLVSFKHVFTHFNANFTPVIARECPADIDCSAGSWFTKQDCLRLALPALLKNAFNLNLLLVTLVLSRLSFPTSKNEGVHF